MIPFSALAPVDEAAILVHFQIIFYLLLSVPFRNPNLCPRDPKLLVEKLFLL